MSDTSDEESIYGYEDEAIEKEALRSPKKLRTNQHPPVPPDEILKPIILKYFYRGHLSYDQVVAYLKKHENIYISKRTLERRLQSWGLRRRDQLDDETIKNWIKEEIVDGSQNRGYRAIYDQIILKHKVYVKRDDIARLMKEIDSLGMKNRRKNRPRSHAVFSLGSDDCCIYDGYDKLLKFGIGIHQGIDVFSKNINWLMCFSTNKRPEHVALYYLRWVKSRGAIPQMTMSDCGTENTLAAVYHRILWTYAHGLYNKNEDEKEVEAFVKEMKPHRFVESIRNQAIGDSWIQLLHHTLQPLIDDFSAKVELGIYSPSDPLQRQVFLYVFLPNVQKRLDDAKELLNHRYKRKDRRSALPSGCSPSYAYDFPESFGGEDMKIPVPPHVIESLFQIYDEVTLFLVHSPRLKRLCDDFMRDNFPETRLSTLLLSEAWVVYEQLLNYVAGIDSIDDMIGWVPDEDEETSSESETDDCNGSVEQVSL